MPYVEESAPEVAAPPDTEPEVEVEPTHVVSEAPKETYPRESRFAWIEALKWIVIIGLPTFGFFIFGEYIIKGLNKFKQKGKRGKKKIREHERLSKEKLKEIEDLVYIYE